MEPRLLSGSTVDTCPTCRGLWVDWFDGELVAIVKETAPLSVRDVKSALRGNCPRCTQPLTQETFDNAVALLRCSDCGGCFVPRASFTMLLELDLPSYSHAHADPKKLDALSRLLLAIRKIFGAEPTTVSRVDE
jgi:Zn-finger nucleic acid-binding protein